MTMRTGAALIALTLATAACDLDLVNPNSPTESTVLTSQDGLIGLAAGLQGIWAGAVRYYALPSALGTDEWGPRSQALAADKSLFAGTPDRGFLIVAEPYRETYDIMRTADNLIENAPQVGFGVGLESGILALAKFYKAMALGQAIQIYEEIPVNIEPQGAEPQPRDVVMDTVLNLLESARQDLAGVTDAELSGFRNRILDPGVDLESSINAMLARYYLIDGQYDAAFEAAGRADTTSASVVTYSGTAMNPIHQYTYALNYVWPLQSFAREAEPGDQRVERWADTTVTDVTVEPTLVQPVTYGEPERTAPYPIYRPDEMTLIQAEVLARQGDLEGAIDLINQVRTQCTPGVEDPAPCLEPLTEADLPTQDDVLEQIAYERRYELFLTGLRLEDLKRLAPYTDAEPKIDFLPLPQRECETNPYVQGTC